MLLHMQAGHSQNRTQILCNKEGVTGSCDLCQAFQTLLVWTEISHHSSLKWLMNFKNPEGQFAPWIEVLSSYDMKVEHRPGRLHSNADGVHAISVVRVIEIVDMP